eukprot:g17669.t1
MSTDAPLIVNSQLRASSEAALKTIVEAVQATASALTSNAQNQAVCFHLLRPFPKEHPLVVNLLEVYSDTSAYEACRKGSVQAVLTQAGLSTSQDSPDGRRTLVLGDDMGEIHKSFQMNPRPLMTGIESGYGLHPHVVDMASALQKASGAGSPAILEFYLAAKDGQEQQCSSLLSQLADVFKEDTMRGVVSFFSVETGFGSVYVQGSDEKAVEGPDEYATRVVLVFGSGSLAALAFQSLQKSWQELFKCCDAPMMIATNETGKLPANLQQALSQVGGGLQVHEGEALAGYLLHSKLAREKESKSTRAFHMRRNVRGDPTLLLMSSKLTDGPSPSSPPPPKGHEDDQVLRIPIGQLLKNMLGRQAASGEGIQAELIFTRLGRLRGLLGLINATNDIHARLREKDPADRKLSDADAYTVESCLANLTALGFVMTKSLGIIDAQWLAELVAELESVYDCDAARKNITEFKQIEYLQLFEYYRVGDVVKAPASSLGSTPVLYRVCDAYYESVRSLMGPRKLSFHLGLEYIATLGDAYAFVSFEVIMGDWEQAQALDKLAYVKVEREGKEIDGYTERGQHLLSLGLAPTYRAYRGSCFFAHGARKAADVSDNGRLVVDTTRGLALGHLVARGKDEDCLAYQLVVKAYRAVQRARSDGMGLDKMEEQLKKAGLRIMETVRPGLGYMIWPAVVGFSLGLKAWGHVVVDGLEAVKPNPVPWTKLVLPKAKKELLLALVESNFDLNAPRLGDIVSSKGSGSLFLLHGVPGTGKTLTVMALAEKFAVPAYYLTFGELGTSVKELEDKMEGVLGMCSSWGALVLLDEGDALVERREKGALLLNSMVGVLLKALDAFEGLLFITTNRVAAFDPAALSRVTLAIRYSSLKNADRQQVWSNVLLRAGCKPEEFDLPALAARGGSGRDINSAARLAMNLAYHRKCQITQALLMEVLDVTADFRKDFAGGLKAHAEAGRVSDDEEEPARSSEKKSASPTPQ